MIVRHMSADAAGGGSGELGGSYRYCTVEADDRETRGDVISSNCQVTVTVIVLL
jgi:hypothetical protein